jgi:hypothetical protein
VDPQFEPLAFFAFAFVHSSFPHHGIRKCSGRVYLSVADIDLTVQRGDDLQSFAMSDRF